MIPISWMSYLRQNKERGCAQVPQERNHLTDQLSQMSEALSGIACFLGFLHNYFRIDPATFPPLQDDADVFLPHRNGRQASTHMRSIPEPIEFI